MYQAELNNFQNKLKDKNKISLLSNVVKKLLFAKLPNLFFLKDKF